MGYYKRIDIERQDRELIDRIDRFDRICANQEYTDTSDVWDLLHLIKTALQGRTK